MVAGDFTDQPSAVREGQSFDVGALAAWLREHVEGLDEGDAAVAQFGRGYSNLTYLVRFGDRELVVRRAPPGVKIKSAHDMGREFKILSHLARVWPKAPRAIACSGDESIIGTPFYVMERVRGVILRARTPAGLALGEARMRRISEATIDTLAAIHSLAYGAAGLGDLGKPEGYVERQIRGWTDRYTKAKTDDVPDFDRLGAWLFANMPKESGASLIHNDFKYDNVILDADWMANDTADDGRDPVRAVLDWEMATVGDPLMDLGTTLGYWIEPDDPPVFQVMVFGPTNLAGNLRRTEVVRRWSAKTGRDASNILYYYAYALYKLAVVAQQLYKRYKDGLTKEERYAPMLEGVRAVTRAALVAVDKGRIDRLGEA
jgi:aminoglycoside phosphotransferase (APT) family kinase protein